MTATAPPLIRAIQLTSPYESALGLTDEQHAIRRRGIGGSEIPAILGLDPYRTAFDVWLAKRGLVERTPSTGPQEWGHIMEPVIAERYVALLQSAGWNVAAYICGTYAHADVSWALATPDRMIETIGDGAADAHLLEIKTRSQWQADEWGEPGTDHIPFSVLAQAQWQLLVLGLSRCDVAVLIGGNDYRQYTVHANAQLHDDLLNQAGEWYERHIVQGIEPPLTGEGAAQWVAKRFPRVRNADAVVPADETNAARLRRLGEVKAAITTLEWEEENLASELKNVIGPNYGIQAPGAGKALWFETSGGTAVDWEGVAREARVPRDLIARYTTTKPGKRQFRYYAPKGA